MRLTTRLLSLALVVALGTAAYAAPLSLEASDNATVQPGGPRSGTSGKAFYNVEGSNNAAFASFGVADFTLPSFGGTAVGINSATLTMVQSNAGFSLAGNVSVYLTQQTGINIQPGTSPLAYTGSDGAASVDSDLLPIALLGTSLYTPLTNGTIDSYTLTFTGPNLTYLLGQLNAGGVLRLVTTPDAASTAATYAGNTNSSFAGPTLNLDVAVVPEPQTIVLLGFGAVGMVLARRASQRAR